MTDPINPYTHKSLRLLINWRRADSPKMKLSLKMPLECVPCKTTQRQWKKHSEQKEMNRSIRYFLCVHHLSFLLVMQHWLKMAQIAQGNESCILFMRFGFSSLLLPMKDMRFAVSVLSSFRWELAFIIETNLDGRVSFISKLEDHLFDGWKISQFGEDSLSRERRLFLTLSFYLDHSLLPLGSLSFLLLSCPQL